MHLNHVDKAEHFFKASIKSSIKVSVTENLRQVRVVHLKQLLTAIIPKSQPLDLGDWAVVVHGWPSAILLITAFNERKSVLVIDSQHFASQLHATAGGHQMRALKSLQMWLVRRNPVVFGARSELDLLTQEVLDPPKLTGGVVSRRARMAMKFTTHPTGGIDRVP
jgi:hypothetical protein